MSVTTGSDEHTTGRTDPSAQEQEQAEESRQYWPAVVCLSLGIFAIVTTEILPIGLLTPIGSDFGVSDGTAGWLMTVPGFLAAICAPLVTVSTGRLDRRTMSVALVVLLAVANFLAAASPAFWVVLVARSLVGVTIGGFWSIGAGLAPRLVRAKAVGTATAVVFAAVPAGSVLGLPAGTQLGEHIGWRASFAVMGVLALGVSVALFVLLPPLPALQVTRAAVLRELLRGADVRIGLAATCLIVIAHFGAYTYVTPFLEQITHVDRGLIGAYLLTFGVAGIVGNFVAGATMARGLRATFLTCAVLIAAATLLFPLLGRWDAGAIGLLVVWGLAYGAVPACSQTWFVRSAPQAQEAAMVVFTSSFQLTLATGALLGGAVVDATSSSTVMLCAGAVALTMVITLTALGGPTEAARHAR
ncbi:MFS transporter [Embleya scabrispora]|uniref:MFS transporter n=1 Tax=Embleya scabrispora TaxID=159449 RepID=UPI000363F165|nr:MFS transporter [Embleya scabrispora]MYS84115.1 MFS transporter [Streptomyces sp. SID5474]